MLGFLVPWNLTFFDRFEGFSSSDRRLTFCVPDRDDSGNVHDENNGANNDRAQGRDGNELEAGRQEGQGNEDYRPCAGRDHFRVSISIKCK